MPKNTSYQRESSREERERAQQIHPIWRGVGFAFAILIPVLSYAATEILLQLNEASNWFPMPYDLVARPGNFLYNGDPWLYLKIILTVAFVLVLYALFTFVTFLANSLFSPARLGPYDVPPVRGKVRKRAR
jgi:hypothetical protein